MAKKKRNKPNLPPEALARARAQLEGQDDSNADSKDNKPKEAPKATPVEQQPQVARNFKKTMTRDELEEEYGYVLRDLSSMGILALILFVGMVAVSLGLNSVL